MLHQTNPSPKTQLATANNSVNTISCIAVCNGADPIVPGELLFITDNWGEKKVWKSKKI